MSAISNGCSLNRSITTTKTARTLEWERELRLGEPAPGIQASYFATSNSEACIIATTGLPEPPPLSRLNLHVIYFPGPQVHLQLRVGRPATGSRVDHSSYASPCTGTLDIGSVLGADRILAKNTGSSESRHRRSVQSCSSPRQLHGCGLPGQPAYDVCPSQGQNSLVIQEDAGRFGSLDLSKVAI
jgi:hypothetical protein